MRSLLLIGLVAGLLVAPALCARSEPAETDDQANALRTLLFWSPPKKVAVIDIKAKTEGFAFANGDANAGADSDKIFAVSDAKSKAFYGGKAFADSDATGYYEGKGAAETDSTTFAKNGGFAKADGYAFVENHGAYASGSAVAASVHGGKAKAESDAYATTKPDP